jgi:hypothetical protein
MSGGLPISTDQSLLSGFTPVISVRMAVTRWRATHKGDFMTADEQIARMTKAINEAIKVMGNRFGSTEGDVAKAIQTLKESLLKEAPAKT